MGSCQEYVLLVMVYQLVDNHLLQIILTILLLSSGHKLLGNLLNW